MKTSNPELEITAKSEPTQNLQCKTKPTEIDEHIWLRVRFRRKMLRMSQTELGVRLGVSMQQIQNYEAGKNRIASSTLYQISRVLLVPISYFYDGFEDDVEERDV